MLFGFQSLSIDAQSPLFGPDTPANTPLDSPVDIADDEDIHDALQLSIENEGSGSNLSAKREARESRAYQEQIALFKTRIAEKDQLIRDLKENMETLRQNQKDRLAHVEQELESIRTRCRDWYQRLMERVREMESAYHDKSNAELSAETRQMEQRLSEEKCALKEQYEAQITNNQHDAKVDSDDLSAVSHLEVHAILYIPYFTFSEFEYNPILSVTLSLFI